ncbi:hypothetical protein [Micromonospora sp. Llam0]|uniref:hypothetical protein n=1 Tax=Micromonospora sp. Llam0 TaxID=2485143 RepID=UPI001F3011BD|nr:hypothetical protein [Micromonospora sp. Llam0]
MRRRTLLTATGVALTFGGIATLTTLVEQGMLDAIAADPDWDQVIGDYNRRLVTSPDSQFGAALVGHLTAANLLLAQAGGHPKPELLSALARLTQLVGLWKGNKGNVVGAWDSYRQASFFAGLANDRAVQAWVGARTASRAPYEGLTYRETVERAERALDLAPAVSPARVEAHSALVHVAALTGNLAAGRQQVAAMERSAEVLPTSGDVDGPLARTASFRIYLESRCGSPEAADTAWDQRALLRGVPVWDADACVYYGMSLVRRGDVAAGIGLALDAARLMAARVQVIGMGVRDLIGMVPAGHRSDALDELRTYASRERGPWEILVR